MKPDTSLVADVQPSTNFNDRKGTITALILHYTGMPDHDQACQWLQNPKSEVSAHYFVHEDGRIIQMVEEQHRAWHAGVSSWKGETDMNSRTIGIEIANAGHPAGCPEFPSVQIEAVIALSKDVIARNTIAPEHVLGHSDIAPGRKIDPGEKFPWDYLHANGVGHWVEPTSPDDGQFFQLGDVGEPVEAFQAMLALYGYGVEPSGQFDERTKTVVEAFQRHFRPLRVDGVADRSTMDTLYRLTRSVPKLA